MSKDRRLGRGLAALLGSESEGGAANHQTVAVPATADYPLAPDAPVEREPDSPQAVSPHQVEAQPGLVRLSVQNIDDNPFQPRRDFDAAEITSLAESLRDHDMLQPVVVREVGDRYQLISGERRLRAAIQAGWSTVPAQIRAADDRLVAELAIVENLLRKDLNPIEKALSFKQYLDQHGCSQEELAGRLKIDRSTVSNLLRLLELPSKVIQAVQTGKLTAGHARALLPLGDEPLQNSYAEKIMQEQWSVREAERQVQDRIANEDGGQQLRVVGGASSSPGRKANQQVAALEQELRVAIGTRVDIRQTARGKGKIIVHFTSHEEFERIRGLLTEPPAVGQSHAG